MANKVLKHDNGSVSVRIDNVYTNNEKHFLVPYNDRYFGSFKFLEVKEAKETLKQAVKQVDGAEDTIFDGQYPKWIEDNYGTSLRVQGRVNFYKDITCQEKVEDVSVRDYIYSIEIHLTKTKNNEIFMRVARAIALREADAKYTDELFEDDLPF